MIEPYWTGISQPPNSISRAPSARCASVSGVRWIGGSSRVGHDGRLGGGARPSAADRRPGASLEHGRGVRDEGPLGLEGQHRGGRVERDPADLVELVVVPGEVAAGRLHQEVVDGLVDARPRLDEPVLDRVERAGDPDLEAGLLARPRGGRSPRASRRRSGVPLGSVQVRPSRSRRRLPDDEPGLARLVANDDPAGGGGGRGPQAGHGADAAPGRRAVPGRPDLAHSMVTVGPDAGRSPAPSTTAGWIARQLARSRASGATSGPRSTVGADAGRLERPGRAEAEPALPRRASTGGRIGPPGGPRTWPRCCDPWEAMVPVQDGLARPSRRPTHLPRRPPVPGRHASSARSISRRAAATYSSSTPGACARSVSRWRGQRPDVAPGHRPGQRGPDAERPGVAERPLDERSVDRQRAGLVEARRPGPARRSRRGARRSRRRPGPPPRGRPPSSPARAGPRWPRSPRPCRPSIAASWSSPSMATVAPWSAATARSVSANATSGWNDPIWVPARHRRGEDLGPERAAGVDHRLAAVHPERSRPAGRWRRPGRPG